MTPLHGLRIIECASFVAAPSACMTLAQLGADVIRVDPIGGAADYRRWPVAPSGTSLYWTALNRGKRSVAVNMRSDEGRELVTALVAEAGILVDNVVGRRWMSYENLSARRADLIHLHLQGHADGRPAVDYTVNAEVGVPTITGRESDAAPVNHVLPAWDLVTGMTVTTGVLAALHERTATGQGAYIEVALADVATAGVANLGWLGEARLRGAERPKHGNHVYGSFGTDFETADGERVMVVALTEHQWHALRKVTGTEDVFSALEPALNVDLNQEADRYRVRETIAAILRPWFAARPLPVVAEDLNSARVLWGRYRGMPELVDDPSPVLSTVDQPGIGEVPSARSPLRWGGEYGGTASAPGLGEHTETVLSDVLGLSTTEIARLHDAGVVASGEA
ncbi:2-methylfumaryl-CoA isomerase [Amycolatopsis sp. K13G38]|uniref:2-methylfumaryl-CoA isomerase n=1 Tax=Amycolatopsis acididurans TaxID=2724524 RepID=A0ABX1JBF4_9PSEU|nr:CoA transferase [Amycolatopsis acididurans]NKQ57029.1 2-methylfumaryl-CoA isomerase [Amycolatopsis acididurans]